MAEKGYTLQKTEDNVDWLRQHLIILAGHTCLLHIRRKSHRSPTKSRFLLYSELKAMTEIPTKPAFPAKQPILILLSIKQFGGFSASLFASSMSGVVFKAFLIASSLVTHSIRGILTSVDVCDCTMIVVVVEE